MSHLLSHAKFILWSREMLLADKLLKEHSLDFWLKVKPNPKTFCLNFYLTNEGEKFVRRFLPTISLVETGVEEKQEDPIEEVELDISLIEKPRSLRDFMKL